MDQEKIKIELVTKVPYGESGARGVDVYARKLFDALSHSTKLAVSSVTQPTGTADCVHFTFFDPFFPTLHLSQHIPTVVTVHDLIPRVFPEHFPAGVKGTVNWLRQKQTVKHATQIVADSDVSKKDIIRLIGVPTQNVEVVRLAPIWDIDAKGDDTLREKYALPDSYVLYVGDINWNKNIVGLIHAFDRAETRDCHLVLAGKVFGGSTSIPELRDIRSALQESSKKSYIHTPGFIEDGDMPALYRQALLYVQPSWYEGFGLPVLEALRVGCPVASSSRGSLPEVGGPYVHYFDPGDTDECVRVLTGLLRDGQERKKYVARGKKWAASFTWEKTAAKMSDIYEKIIADNH